MHGPGSGVSGYGVLLCVQVIFLVIFGVFSNYDEKILPQKPSSNENNTTFNSLVVAEEPKHHVASYAHFQDIHVMIFVGFAFLMTFLKKYGYSATGFNLFLGALVIQWAVICRGFFEMEDGVIRISLDSLIGADIAAAAVLISMGALLGRVTPIQLLVMGLFEIAVFSANEYLQLEVFMITDAGGSIVVHAFGAYFGLAVSLILRPGADKNEAGKLEGASYTSDTFAMVGTLFLWIFWPSFNSALLDGADQERAIINTYLSLGAATVTSFVISAIVSHEHKLDMVHIQNSTLAGGVAVGAVCNLLIGPYGAVLIGIIAGILSVLGYRYLSPIITAKLRIHDTCGVHNLHGMPAVLSALFSAIYAALAKKENYFDSLTEIFPAMNEVGSDAAKEHNATIIGGFGRTAIHQGGYQLLGILVTVGIAIVSGIITGLVLKSPSMRKLEKENHHDDSQFWEVPAETP